MTFEINSIIEYHAAEKINHKNQFDEFMSKFDIPEYLEWQEMSLLRVPFTA